MPATTPSGGPGTRSTVRARGDGLSRQDLRGQPVFAAPGEAVHGVARRTADFDRLPRCRQDHAALEADDVEQQVAVDAPDPAARLVALRLVVGARDLGARDLACEKFSVAVCAEDDRVRAQATLLFLFPQRRAETAIGGRAANEAVHRAKFCSGNPHAPGHAEFMSPRVTRAPSRGSAPAPRARNARRGSGRVAGPAWSTRGRAASRPTAR